VPDLLFPMGVSTDMVSSSCSVVAVALEDLSLRVCVLLFRDICVFWVLSTLFFFVRESLGSGCEGRFFAVVECYFVVTLSLSQLIVILVGFST